MVDSSQRDVTARDGDRKAAEQYITEIRLMDGLRWLGSRSYAGLDKTVYAEYAAHAEVNIRQLYSRITTGDYHLQFFLNPLFVPTKNGLQNSISVQALEDGIVQIAIADLLNDLFDPYVLDCASELRRAHGQRQPLEELRQAICAHPTQWVFTFDIYRYIAADLQRYLVGLVDNHVKDINVQRVVKEWIKFRWNECGRLVLGQTWKDPEYPISLVLANICLHCCLDEPFRNQALTEMKGTTYEIRSGSEVILCFEQKEDAEGMLEYLRPPLKNSGLVLHPKKAALIEFGRGAIASAESQGEPPDSFDFLGYKYQLAKNSVGKPLVRVLPLPRNKPASVGSRNIDTSGTVLADKVGPAGLVEEWEFLEVCAVGPRDSLTAASEDPNSLPITPAPNSPSSSDVAPSGLSDDSLTRNQSGLSLPERMQADDVATAATEQEEIRTAKCDESADSLLMPSSVPEQASSDSDPTSLQPSKEQLTIDVASAEQSTANSSQAHQASTAAESVATVLIQPEPLEATHTAPKTNSSYADMMEVPSPVSVGTSPDQNSKPTIQDTAHSEETPQNVATNSSEGLPDSSQKSSSIPDAKDGESTVMPTPSTKSKVSISKKVKLSEIEIHPDVEIILRELECWDIWESLWKSQQTGYRFLREEGALLLIKTIEFQVVKKDKGYLCLTDTRILRQIKSVAPIDTFVRVQFLSKVNHEMIREYVLAEYVLRPVLNNIPSTMDWAGKLRESLKKMQIQNLIYKVTDKSFAGWLGIGVSTIRHSRKKK